jgi:hypothetical protein
MNNSLAAYLYSPQRQAAFIPISVNKAIKINFSASPCNRTSFAAS